MKTEQIPQKLDNPAQVFWLEVDEIMPFFICWAAGLFLRKLTGSTWMVTGGIAVGIFFSWVYMKHKRGSLPGALQHIFYNAGVIGLNKRFSNGLLRSFTK